MQPVSQVRQVRQVHPVLSPEKIKQIQALCLEMNKISDNMSKYPKN